MAVERTASTIITVENNSVLSNVHLSVSSSLISSECVPRIYAFNREIQRSLSKHVLECVVFHPIFSAAARQTPSSVSRALICAGGGDRARVRAARRDSKGTESRSTCTAAGDMPLLGGLMASEVKNNCDNVVVVSSAIR